MTELESLYSVALQIISAVGTARSMYIEAIQEAKVGNVENARKLISEGEMIAVEGHHAHAELIQKEASGEFVQFSLMVMHAEDQLMSAETFKTMAEEFIDVYEKINK